MAVEDWKLGSDGNIMLAPVVAWNTAIGGMYALLRLQFVRSEEELQRGQFEASQVAMTAKQARQLADDLRNMADRLDAQDWGNSQ